MYQIIRSRDVNIIGICVENWFEVQDCHSLFPYLKKQIFKQRNVRILEDLRLFKGIRFWAFLKFLFFFFKNSSALEKKAIITDAEWVYNWAVFLAFLSKTKIRCFPSSEYEDAWEWLQK